MPGCVTPDVRRRLQRDGDGDGGADWDVELGRGLGQPRHVGRLALVEPGQLLRFRRRAESAGGAADLVEAASAAGAVARELRVRAAQSSYRCVGSYANPWFVIVLNPLVTPLEITSIPFGAPATDPQRSIGRSAIGLHEFEAGS